jgi:hypothetical protein
MRRFINGQGLTATYVKVFPKISERNCASGYGRMFSVTVPMGRLHFERKLGRCAEWCPNEVNSLATHGTEHNLSSKQTSLPRM